MEISGKVDSVPGVREAPVDEADDRVLADAVLEQFQFRTRLGR